MLWRLRGVNRRLWRVVRRRLRRVHGRLRRVVRRRLRRILWMLRRVLGLVVARLESALKAALSKGNASNGSDPGENGGKDCELHDEAAVVEEEECRSRLELTLRADEEKVNTLERLKTTL